MLVDQGLSQYAARCPILHLESYRKDRRPCPVWVVYCCPGGLDCLHVADTVAVGLVEVAAGIPGTVDKVAVAAGCILGSQVGPESCQ